MKEQTQYTFEDWLQNKFWDEKGLDGEFVCNDSENYLDLVDQGKMTYDVLNDIQDAQSQTYEYMIKCTLEAKERFIQRQASKSLDLQKVLYFEVSGVLSNNSTTIKTQNNYVQINGRVLSQETVKQLQPEQLQIIESVLDTAVQESKNLPKKQAN